MSVKIRLAKTGKKHRLSFRLVAQDTRSKKDGKYLENLGFWLPFEKGAKSLKIKNDRLNYWVSKGAKPTEAVTKLLGFKNSIKSQHGRSS